MTITWEIDTIKFIIDFEKRKHYQPHPSEIANGMNEETATIQKRLNKLQESGYIELIYDENGRVRAYDILWKP